MTKRHKAPWRAQRRFGAYSLATKIADQLENALQGARNANSTWKLAFILIKLNRRTPRRFFTIDRRAIAEHFPEYDLTEKTIRSACKLLQQLGIIERTGLGGQWRPDRETRAPILWRFSHWIVTMLTTSTKWPIPDLRSKKDQIGPPENQNLTGAPKSRTGPSRQPSAPSQPPGSKTRPRAPDRTALDHLRALQALQLPQLTAATLGITLRNWR